MAKCVWVVWVCSGDGRGWMWGGWEREGGGDGGGGCGVSGGCGGGYGGTVDQVLLRHPEPLEVLERKIYAPPHRVLANITKDVRDLQGDAERDGRLFRLLHRVALRGTHYRQAHEAHC